jgi:precorrin-6Y C5,15-methyltransferase (decarboxylating)
MAGLAPASRAELSRATVIYGAPRQLGLLDGTVTAQRREWCSPLAAVLERIGAETAADVHVLASGDPMLHGIGSPVIRYFGAQRVTVLPHVSSVTLACARVGWDVQHTEVISLVTEQPHTAVRRGGRAIVLCRDGSGAATLARLLTETGRGESELTVLEQLGGPAERRRTGTAAQWVADPPGDVDDLNVVAVRYLPDDWRLQVLPDDAFATDGQLTKQPMRAVTLAVLAPRPGELLWDVGAGSGSIAIEWCRSGPGCRAIAFERDERRRTRIAANAVAHGAAVEVRGEAPAAFPDVGSQAPRPAAIFIGGGLTGDRLAASCLDHLEPGGRLVANAVTVESEAALAHWHATLGGELLRFQHYRGEPVGGFTGWRPAMPVTQWSVTKQ